MPAPSRLTIITVKNPNFFFDFLKLYNELGKVKFFQVSIIWFRGCNCSFPLGGALNAPPLRLIGLKNDWLDHCLPHGKSYNIYLSTSFSYCFCIAQWATMCQFGKNEFYNWENTGDSFKTTVILQSLRKCISFFI